MSHSNIQTFEHSNINPFPLPVPHSPFPINSSDETEHKLRSEDAFCQLRLGRENLLEFVWRDGVIAPYLKNVKLANYQTDSTCKLLSSLESRQVLQFFSLTVYQLYKNQTF